MINAYDLVKKYTETTFKDENEFEDPCIIVAANEKIIRVEGSKQSGKSTTVNRLVELIKKEDTKTKIEKIEGLYKLKYFSESLKGKSPIIAVLDISITLYDCSTTYAKTIKEVTDMADLVIISIAREHKGLQTIMKMFEKRNTFKDLEDPVDACAIEIVENKYFRVYGPKESGQIEVSRKLKDIEKELSPGIDFDELTITNNNYKKILKRIKSNIQNNIKTIVVEDNFKTELTKDEYSIIEEAREKVTLYIMVENTTAFKTIETIKVWNDNLLDEIKELFENDLFTPSHFKYSDSISNNKVIIGWNNVELYNFNYWSQWFKDGRLEVSLVNYKTDFCSIFEGETNSDHIESYIVIDNCDIKFVSKKDRVEIDSINVDEIKSIEMCIENKFNWEYFIKGFARHIAETKYITFISKDDKPVIDVNYSMHCYLNEIIKQFLINIKIRYRFTTHYGTHKEFEFNLEDKFCHQCFEQLNEFHNLVYLLESKIGEQGDKTGKFPFFKISADYVMSSAYLVANYLQNNKEFNDLVNKNIKK